MSLLGLLLNRVSLCGCRVRKQSPSRNVVFYVGDRVEGTDNAEIERLSNPKNIASILVSKLGPFVNAWIIEPSHWINNSFACYENLLPSLPASGEPRGYNPQGLPAARSTLSLLHDCLAQVTNLNLLCPSNSVCNLLVQPWVPIFFSITQFECVTIVQAVWIRGYSKEVCVCVS